MEEEQVKKNEGRRRVNIGARLSMIAPVIALGCTAIIAIHGYRQGYGIFWWLIIFFASLAGFYFLGSVLQTVVELFVDRILDREEEERKLREMRAMNGEPETEEEAAEDAGAFGAQPE